LELPPSMMTSPFENSPVSSSTVESVMCPAGSMTQTALGEASFPARSARLVAASAPLAAAAFTASALRS
jgi:hypothetical protein